MPTTISNHSQPPPTTTTTGKLHHKPSEHMPNNMAHQWTCYVVWLWWCWPPKKMTITAHKQPPQPTITTTNHNFPQRMPSAYGTTLATTTTITHHPWTITCQHPLPTSSNDHPPTPTLHHHPWTMMCMNHHQPKQPLQLTSDKDTGDNEDMGDNKDTGDDELRWVSSAPPPSTPCPLHPYSSLPISPSLSIPPSFSILPHPSFLHPSPFLPLSYPSIPRRTYASMLWTLQLPICNRLSVMQLPGILHD